MPIHEKGIVVVEEKDEALTYFESLSNWGRWGDGDELGTLNLITDETRLAAAGSIRSGRAVSCSRAISPRESGNLTEFIHFMTATGGEASKEGKSSFADWIGIPVHGPTFTHLDSPSHEGWNGNLYNGRSVTNIRTSGTGWCSVDGARDGLVGRGVLLDVARALEVDWLDATHSITVDELELTADRQGVSVGKGDIVMIRTGREAREQETGYLQLRSDGSPGLEASCLPWIHEKGVSVLVSDWVHDLVPSKGQIDMPIHMVGIVAMGLWLIDSASLSRLATACEELKQWSGQFMAAPLVLKRTTGSPINPVMVL